MGLRSVMVLSIGPYSCLLLRIYCRHTPHAVVYIVCSPDDGHNNARNMFS